MTGQVVRLTGDALGFNLNKGNGWSEGYVVMVNLTVIHKVFETEKDAKAFAATLPEGWEPPLGVWTGKIPGSD